MYKKILLIAFSTLVKNQFARCTYLMSFVTFFIWITAKYRPFIINNNNYLEYYSAFCSLIIIVTSAFYVENDNEAIQTIFLILIIYMNTLFIAKWCKSVFKLLLFKYRHILLRYLPTLYLISKKFIESKGIISFVISKSKTKYLKKGKRVTKMKFVFKKKIIE